jgi:hypothetical protein
MASTAGRRTPPAIVEGRFRLLLLLFVLLCRASLVARGQSAPYDGAAWQYAQGGSAAASHVAGDDSATAKRGWTAGAWEQLDYHELVHLLHRAAAPAHTMAHVRSASMSGRDFGKLSAAGARGLFNCTAGMHCIQPAWCHDCATSTPTARTNTPPSQGAETPGISPDGAAEIEDDPRQTIARIRGNARLLHPNLLKYARQHARARRLPPSASNRFVVWTCGCCGEPCSGWGNRMLGIVSALMLAVLTERAFLIHWPADACAPLSDYIGSEWIDWRLPANFRSLLSAMDQEYLVNLEPVHGFEMSEKFRSMDPRSLDSKAVVSR